jgi:hypothetical protein
MNARRSTEDIVKEAKARALWIYDPTYKKWYTPEDFQHIFGHYANADEQFLNQLQVRHPSEGIQAGFQRLMEIHNRLKEFTKLVMEYYKK